jgi:hypothetical protein
MLKDREELLAVKPGSKEAAEASHRIRSQIKQLREDAMRLQAHQKQEEKKVSVTVYILEKSFYTVLTDRFSFASRYETSLYSRYHC